MIRGSVVVIVKRIVQLFRGRPERGVDAEAREPQQHSEYGDGNGQCG